VDSLIVAAGAVSWTMADTNVATASADQGGTGPWHSTQVAGMSDATTTLTLSIPGFSDDVVVHSTPVASVTVMNPGGIPAQLDSLFAIGETVQLTAVAYDVNGIELPARPARWSTSDPTVATVSNDGLVTGVGHGQVLITAWIDNRTYDVWFNVQ
jgi:uncharacterized protein YjdB